MKHPLLITCLSPAALLAAAYMVQRADMPGVQHADTVAAAVPAMGCEAATSIDPAGRRSEQADAVARPSP